MSTQETNPALQAIQTSVDENLESSQVTEDSLTGDSGEEYELEKVSAPELLEIIESNNHRGGQCFNIQLYAEGCFDCVSLVEGAAQEFKKCHFTMGNTHCPAQYFKISFIGEKVKWEKKIKRIKDMPQGPERTDLLIALVEKVSEIEDSQLRSFALKTIGL